MYWKYLCVSGITVVALIFAGAAPAAGVSKINADPGGIIRLDNSAKKAVWKSELESLSAQSLKDCLTELPRTNMYFWRAPRTSGTFFSTGSDGARSLTAGEERMAVEAVLGSPRVRRVFELANSVPRSELAGQIDATVEQLLPAYCAAYASNENLRKTKDNSKAEYLAGLSRGTPMSFSGVCITTHIPDETAVTVEGQRFALLACAWLIGELELKEGQNALLAIVDEALRQREALEVDEHFMELYKRQLEEFLALYNRTLLGTALLRMANQGPKREEAVAALGLNKYQQDLLPVSAEPILRPEGSRADFSAPTLVQRSVELYDNMTDAQFDALRAALR